MADAKGRELRLSFCRRFDDRIVSVPFVVRNVFRGYLFDDFERNLLEVCFRFFRFGHELFPSFHTEA